jgi:5'-phosphate synthase pdxT subunit
VTVGILALQGGFASHAEMLARIGVATRLVRKTGDLAGLAALVLPGGESTAMLLGLARDGFEAPLRAFVHSGRPVLGTCAGAILLAHAVRGPAQRSFDALDVDVERNAYGTQLDSFAAEVDAGGAFPRLHAVFIRAPRIVRVGAAVEVLARVDGDPVLVRRDAVWAATFHPELGDDDRVHRAWLLASRRPVRGAAPSHAPA